MIGMECSKMHGSLSRQTKAVLDKYLKQHGLHIASNKHGMLMEVQRHVIEQQVQDSTEEEENPPCSSEDEEEYLSFDERDYVLAEIGLSSEKDEDNVQITVKTTKSGRRATHYLL
jgi:hypothetical protein